MLLAPTAVISMFLGFLDFAYRGLSNEIVAPSDVLWWLGLWAVGPAVIVATYLIGAALVRDPRFELAAVLLFLGVCDLVSFAPAIGGPSTPDTAGHMQVVTAPLFLSIIEIPLFLLINLRSDL